MKQRSTPGEYLTKHLAHIEGGDEYAQMIHKPILLLGAGGLGCELVKNVAVSGFTNVHIIDLDTIDMTNLNRQFLFTPADIGKSKAEVAAARVTERFPGVTVVPHFCRMETLPPSFYAQFTLIIGGLDSVKARSWMNATLLQLYHDGAIESGLPIPFIDGGTEGLKGNARVIIPEVTPCFDCLDYLFPKQTTFPLCTIANTPRLPEHCIEYAHQVLFVDHHHRPVDTDSGDDVSWVFNAAKARADEYRIDGVTFSLTVGVVKNVIPAIASTNAIIAAVCVTEALKLTQGIGEFLNNYLLYNGQGFHFMCTQFEACDDCRTCQQMVGQERIVVRREDTVKAWLHGMQASGREVSSIIVNGRGVYFSFNPEAAVIGLRMHEIGSDTLDVTFKEGGAKSLLLEFEE